MMKHSKLLTGDADGSSRQELQAVWDAEDGLVILQHIQRRSNPLKEYQIVSAYSLTVSSLEELHQNIGEIIQQLKGDSNQ